MKKTININITGVVFQIDDDAFEKLRNYLQAVNTRFRNIPGGSEAVDDFEARVAEILQGRRGITGIVTIDDVNEVISVMGRPEDIDDGYDDAPGEPGPAAQRRLYRDPDETIIAGVAGGIGSYLNADPVWFRLIFILTTIFYGFGFFIYIALWVALPVASTEVRKRELCGHRYSPLAHGRKRGRGAGGNDAVDRVGGALNEVFRALGRFIVILVRVIAIIVGTSLVIAGFALLALIISALVFNYGPWLPGAASTDTFHFTELFSVIFTQGAVPWVVALSIMVTALPLLGIAYWGIRMIFRFKARDGVISITALVMWVVSAVALTMILFSQGISFAESGRYTEVTEIEAVSDTLVVTAGREMAPGSYDKKIPVPFDDIFWLYRTEAGDLFCSPIVKIRSTDQEKPRIEVTRYSHGHTRETADDNAGGISYDYSFRNDTLALGTFFPVPGKTRWNGSMVRVRVYIPEGQSIYLDEKIEPFISYPSGSSRHKSEPGGSWWTMTENGLTPG